jgi:hypothetical protein
MIDLLFQLVKDDVVMSYKVYKQVINENTDFLMDNYQKPHEEIDFQLKEKFIL